MGLSRAGVWIRRALLILLLAVGVAAVSLYLLASRVPRRYRPASLNARQRTQSAKLFAGKMLGPQFGGKIQQPHPFSLSFSAEELNRYLASMDEIAALPPGGEPGRVYRVMERSGVADPALVLGEGTLTLMFRLVNYGKILSLDLSLRYTPRRRLRVELLEVRLGEIAIPRSAFQGRLDNLRGALGSKSGQPAGSGDADDEEGGISIGDVSAVLAKVIASIGAEPISTELPKKINGRIFRVDDIEISDERLTLHFAPVLKR